MARRSRPVHWSAVEVQFDGLEEIVWDRGEHAPGGISFGMVRDVKANHAAGAATFGFSTGLLVPDGNAGSA